MTRPLIALPGRTTHRLDGARTAVVFAGIGYTSALERAGAEPVIVAPFADGADVAARAAATVARLDGLVLIGGGDIDPARYGQIPHAETVGVRPHQDAFEIAMLQAAMDRDLPILAICRGMQLLNVSRGGTLFQHIPDRSPTITHRLAYHDVALDSASNVALAMAATATRGHSVHHQAVEVLGRGLRVTGTAPDGTIEAIELDRGWVIGVQWHPEDSAADDPHHQALFDELVRRARSR